MVSIAGHSLSALVDTGSDGGLLTPEMVGYLRLRLDPEHETVVHGTGGVAQATPMPSCPTCGWAAWILARAPCRWANCRASR
ncbi:aspartyl protease family protein [Komagataeibacter rhaeticus]|nr:aspartyl protease family protein [Komagataeibacter rhaeticus]